MIISILQQLHDEAESAYDQFWYKRDRLERIRQMARCVEYGTFSMEQKRPWFLRQLRHRHPRIRNAAAEAIWQLADLKSLPAMERALEVEKHETCQRTMKHVVHLMGGNENV